MINQLFFINGSCGQFEDMNKENVTIHQYMFLRKKKPRFLSLHICLCFRDVLKTLSHVYDGTLYENCERLKAVEFLGKVSS